MLSEKRNLCLRLLKNKGFKDEGMTKGGSYAIGTSTTLESNKSPRRNHIRAFDVLPNGLLAKQTDRVFADLRGSEPGVSDGMKVDREGNVYCGGAGGLWILDPQGTKLGRIVHGQPATTNMGFGGDDWKTLYFTTRTHLFAVNVKIPGVAVPPQKP